jgi:glycosyltransferase involved in cell wall biosynthesis
MTRAEKISVEVIVLSKDEPELEKTLSLLKKECEKIGAGCMVVDASSNRLDWIKDKHPWVRWLEYQPSGNKSSIPQQRNVGVNNSKASIIAFCDAGGTPEEGWLENLVEPILNKRSEYTCGPVKSTRPGVYRIINDVEDGESVDGPPTANVAFTKNLFHEVGGFDERYLYGSDVDFAWKSIEIGKGPICSKKAVMGMDWGPWKLQQKRAWRYGKARARLTRIHPKRRLGLLKSQPEITAYPALVLGGIVSLLFIHKKQGRIGMISVLAAVFGLRWRNRKEEKPWSVMADHLIYGSSYWDETLRGPRYFPKVVHTPADKGGPYVENLVRGLNKTNTRARIGEGPTKSATLNLLLFPLKTMMWRVYGAKIWHIHWMWGNSLGWAKTPTIQKILRVWFEINLKLARRWGLKIVWTAHNLYPHEQVFDDDRKARQVLVENCETVIVHNESAAKLVMEEFAPKRVEIIEQGNIVFPKTTKSAARRELEIKNNEYVILGYGKIARYKNYTKLIEAVASLPKTEAERVRVRIVGEVGEISYLHELRQISAQAEKKGARIEIIEKYATEEEIGRELAASDLVSMISENILNSSTLRGAQSAGRVALVLRGGELDQEGTISTEISNIARVLKKTMNLETTERRLLEKKALLNNGDTTWERCAARTSELYQGLLQDGNMG